jgi:hypothetical protein
VAQKTLNTTPAFHNLFFHETSLKITFSVPSAPIYENKNKTKSLLLVVHGDYTNIANYGKKFL